MGFRSIWPNVCALTLLPRNVRRPSPLTTPRTSCGRCRPLAHTPKEFGPEVANRVDRRPIDRLDDPILGTRTPRPDYKQIWNRLYSHCNELFTIPPDPAVPGDRAGTGCELRPARGTP